MFTEKDKLLTKVWNAINYVRLHMSCKEYNIDYADIKITITRRNENENN